MQIPYRVDAQEIGDGAARDERGLLEITHKTMAAVETGQAEKLWAGKAWPRQRSLATTLDCVRVYPTVIDSCAD